VPGERESERRRPERARLELLQSSDPPERWTWFCAYCGAARHKSEPPEPIARACRSCGVGILIEAPEPIAPGPQEAFLVIDHDLRVQAVALRAERLLNLRETDVVGSELTDLLLPIDSETQGSGLLTDAVFVAASGEPMPIPVHLALRLAAHPALTLRARIGRCGPARAALIVLEPSGGG
jgi:PAS domain-containing protein